jgi:hypothetical protein
MRYAALPILVAIFPPSLHKTSYPKNEKKIKGKNRKLQKNESWALKKEKRCKEKECIIYSTK